MINILMSFIKFSAISDAPLKLKLKYNKLS